MVCQVSKQVFKNQLDILNLELRASEILVLLVSKRAKKLEFLRPFQRSRLDAMVFLSHMVRIAIFFNSSERFITIRSFLENPWGKNYQQTP